jgi:hypothetical protein
MTQKTAQMFHALPPQEQAHTAIFANDYGEAAAIDFLGPRYGLPASISKAETYRLWGHVSMTASDGRGDREHFRSVQPAGCGGLKVFPCRRTVHHLPMQRHAYVAGNVVATDKGLVA